VLSVNNYVVREVAIVALRVVVMKFKYKAVQIDIFPPTISFVQGCLYFSTKKKKDVYICTGKLSKISTMCE